MCLIRVLRKDTLVRLVLYAGEQLYYPEDFEPSHSVGYISTHRWAVSRMRTFDFLHLFEKSFQE